LIEEERQVLGVKFSEMVVKAADVAEHHGDVGFFWFDECGLTK